MAPMNPIALYFASGESLYLGATLLLLVMVASPLLTRSWLLRLRNALALVALALIVLACPPFTLVVDLIFIAVFALWFITSNQSLKTRVSKRLQQVSTLVLTVLMLVLTAIELSHRRMPRITAGTSSHLVVLGDSISSGIDPRVSAWPLVLQQTCGVEVRNLARPGAQVTDALLMTRELKQSDHLVLIETPHGPIVAAGVTGDSSSLSRSSMSNWGSLVFLHLP